MTNGGRTSRIGRLVDRYSLLGMGADLESQWRNDPTDQQDRLAALTTYFNTAIVQAVFAGVGPETADHSAAEVYRWPAEAPAEPAPGRDTDGRLGYRAAPVNPAKSHGIIEKIGDKFQN